MVLEGVFDSPPHAIWLCDACEGICCFGMDLGLHPCNHCGLVGQDPSHPDCECSAELKFDCPCNPGAVAFPLFLCKGGKGPQHWVNPRTRYQYVQDCLDQIQHAATVKEAKRKRALHELRLAEVAARREPLSSEKYDGYAKHGHADRKGYQDVLTAGMLKYALWERAETTIRPRHDYPSKAAMLVADAAFTAAYAAGYTSH